MAKKDVIGARIIHRHLGILVAEELEVLQRGIIKIYSN